MTPEKIQKAMRRALTAAQDSHDVETQVGAVLISPRTGSVISEGFNGFVRGANDEKLPKTRPEKYPYMMHAEENIISNACRNGIKTDEGILVLTMSPCKRCMRLCWQAGIKEIYCLEKYRDLNESKNMGDLVIEFTNIGEYYKIQLKSARE